MQHENLETRIHTKVSAAVFGTVHFVMTWAGARLANAGVGTMWDGAHETKATAKESRVKTSEKGIGNYNNKRNRG